jgi:hypothetical protein
MGTTTTNIELYKPTAGETGWDDEVNANFDTIDERLHKPLGIQYVDRRGDNANDGLTPGTAVQDVVTAYDNLDDDGGEIRVISSVTGGDIPFWDMENQDRGLWLVGPNDVDSYATLPTGWRRQKTLRLVGYGGREMYGDNTGSPHGVTYIAGGSATDPLKPGLWIVGTGAPMYFENIRIVNLAQPVKLGLSAADGTTNVNTARIKFHGCYFRSNPVAATSEAAVKIGYAFWVWFDHCVFSAPVEALTVSGVALSSGTTYTFTNSSSHGLAVGDVVDVTDSSVAGYNGNWTVASVPTAATFTADIGTNPSAFSGTATSRTLLSDRRASIFLDASGSESNGGIIEVTSCIFNRGGFRFRPAGSSTWGAIVMEDVLDEGDFTNDEPPVFHMPVRSSSVPFYEIAAGSGFIYLRNLGIADAGAPYGAVNLEGVSSPGMVTAINCGPIIGPVQSAGGNQVSSLADGDKVGMFQNEPNRVFGASEGHKRAFHPTVARYANLAPYDETTWEAGSGTATVTTGQRAPDGSTRAGLLTAVAAADSTTIYIANRTVNIGDFFIWGGWVKAGANGWYEQSSFAPFRLALSGGGTTFKFDTAQVPSATVDAGPRYSFDRTDDGDWQFVARLQRVSEGATNPDVSLQLQVHTGFPLYIYAPFLVHVPVADGMTYADARQYRDSIASYSNSLAVGEVGTLAGQRFHAVGGMRIAGTVHASLPAASGYASGTQYYCSGHKQPIWSDGSSWYEADGTVH